ncbi:MAG: hypothetical protein ABH856_03695 [Patescibacteria group bacterium]|nr:hypothetical protein [Patescibacteria group bacterium]
MSERIDIREVCDVSPFFAEWAQACEKKRVERDEYLINPPRNSDLWIKRLLLEKALKPIAAKDKNDEVNILESKGANMEVYDFMPDQLYYLLVDLFQERYGMVPSSNVDIIFTCWAQWISERYVFKVGNTRDYVVRFGSEPNTFPRDHMEEGFAPLGFPVKNTEKRVAKNAREVARANAWTGNEKKTPITGPTVIDEIRRLIASPRRYSPAETSAHFVRDDGAREGQNIETIYNDRSEDGEMGGSFDYSDYCEWNERMRSFDENVSGGDLEPFFEALMTIGFHDSVRKIFGYGKHTTRNYEQALGIIKELCEDHKDESFMIPEQTTFGYDPRVSGEEWGTTIKGNGLAADVFRVNLLKYLPDGLRYIFRDESVMREFSHKIMEHWHRVPDYEVEQETSVFSMAMVKFVVKAAYLYFLKPGSDRREDFDKDEDLSKFFECLTERQRGELQKAVTFALFGYLDYTRRGICKPYQRLEKTQVKTQDRLDYNGDGWKAREGPMSIAKLVNERKGLLDKYPEIAEKLVVYFFQLYRFYQDTGYVLDMRSENVVKYAFGFGEWAVQTENLQITIFENERGETYVKVVNVDPEDHFRATPKTEWERDSREGLATYGLNLTGPIGYRALLKAIARFVDHVADNRGIVGEKERWSLLERLAQLTQDLLRESKATTEQGIELSRISTRDQVSKVLRGLRRVVQSVIDKA